MAKLLAICVIIAIAAHNDWELEQIDIEGAYLNVTLSKIIYMCQLKGYEILGKEDHICLQQCTIYDLKQAGCEWYHHFYKVMHKIDFTHCQDEHAVSLLQVHR